MASTVAADLVPLAVHAVLGELCTRTGWKVPAPTCSVTVRAPRPRAKAASKAASKCSAAVGAATAPGRRANTVW
jgi:hypothetical protein